jgi:hypothetical protein
VCCVIGILRAGGATVTERHRELATATGIESVSAAISRDVG